MGVGSVMPHLGRDCSRMSPDFLHSPIFRVGDVGKSNRFHRSCSHSCNKILCLSCMCARGSRGATHPPWNHPRIFASWRLGWSPWSYTGLKSEAVGPWLGFTSYIMRIALRTQVQIHLRGYAQVHIRAWHIYIYVCMCMYMYVYVYVCVCVCVCVCHCMCMCICMCICISICVDIYI